MSSIAENSLMITDPELDLAARSFWEQDFEQRDKAFARLRTERPVAFGIAGRIPAVRQALAMRLSGLGNQ